MIFSIDCELDERLLKDRSSPAHGAYVVFSLNPVATVKALEDPIATAQAQMLPIRKYVGYVDEHMDVSLDRKFHNCAVAFVSQGLPEASPSKGIDENMCMPIAGSPHPSRAGVIPSPPLPWTNLYHHTMLTMAVCVPARREDYTNCSLLCDKDLMAMTSVFDADCRRRDSLQYQFEHGRPRSPSRRHCPVEHSTNTHQDAGLFHDLDIGTDSPPDAHLEDEQTVHSPRSGTEPYRNDDIDADACDDIDSLLDTANFLSDSEYDALMAQMENDPAYKEAWERLPVVDYSLDLSTATEFCDGRYFFEDVESLQTIKVESKQRRQAQVDEEFLKDSMEGTSLTSPSRTASFCVTTALVASGSSIHSTVDVSTWQSEINHLAVESQPLPARTSTTLTMNSTLRTLMSCVGISHTSSSVAKGISRRQFWSTVSPPVHKASFISRSLSILTLGCFSSSSQLSNGISQPPDAEAFDELGETSHKFGQ